MLKTFITLTFVTDKKPLKLNPLAIESFFTNSVKDYTIIVCSNDTYQVTETPDEIEAEIDEWMKHQVGTIQ